MKLGRPMEFDPDIALSKAMNAFWSNGYEATSTADLMSCMGISKSSLYQTFGSKRELFLKCLEAYCLQAKNKERVSLGGRPPDKQFIVDLFRAFVSPRRKTKSPPGCLLINSACEFGSVDSEISAFVDSRFSLSREKFQEAIERSQAAGDISQDTNAEMLASLLQMSLCGLRVMEKSGASRRTMQLAVDQVLQHLD